MGAQGRVEAHWGALRPPSALQNRWLVLQVQPTQWGPGPLTCQGIPPRHDGVGDPSGHDALGEGNREGLPDEAPNSSS